MNSKYRSDGLGFGSVLFFIFLVLKLTHVINWSWWWVTAPLWGGIALAAGIFIIGVVFIFATYFIIWAREKG